MKYLLIFILIISSQLVSAQDTLSLENTYIFQDLVYNETTDNLVTGVVQRTRRNGHIVAEEIYEQGIILEWKLYFNNSNRRLAEKKMYYKEFPLRIKERIKYITNKDGKFIERIFFDSTKKKTLKTTHKDTVLVYSMPYINGKKNGQEFCFDGEGNPMIIEFINGKKVKN